MLSLQDHQDFTTAELLERDQPPWDHPGGTSDMEVMEVEVVMADEEMGSDEAEAGEHTQDSSRSSSESEASSRSGSGSDFDHGSNHGSGHSSDCSSKPGSNLGSNPGCNPGSGLSSESSSSEDEGGKPKITGSPSELLC